jgi:predicted amidohydrolase
MKVALATPPFSKSIDDALSWLKKLVQEAAGQGADIICFPESYLPGYPLHEFKPEDRTPEILETALKSVCQIAAEFSIAIIIPMDWHFADGIYNLAYVISATGEIMGYQTKNQLDPSEDKLWLPGTNRELFEVNGLKFGITICHEGFRYPESVRWAAMRGAHIVFHPHCTGSDVDGPHLTDWGARSNPYYEKAMMMRAMENTIYFASSNYSSKYPESATSLIAPDGSLVAWQPYREAGVFVAEIDIDLATGLLAKRFKPGLVG